MKCSLHRLLALAIQVCTGMHQAAAADQVLEFKLVTRIVEVKAIDAKNVEGQNVGLASAHGVAYFKDGRVASKDFVTNWDYNKGSGPLYGYSTYTFEDGSTIVARFTGATRAGQGTRGEYTLLSGSGVYAGAKGTGTFESVPTKFQGATLYNGKFMLTTP